MTPQELREGRLNILEAMLLELSPSQNMIFTEGEEWLDKLDALDAAYADSKRKPEVAFYTHLNTLDADMRAYVGTQGDTAAELRLIETIQKHLAARAGQLEEGQ